MKHFITAIPLQITLSAVKYDNPTHVDFLDSGKAFTYPILVPIQNLAKRGEKIRVTAIVTNHGHGPDNFEIFAKELKELSDEIGFEYEIKQIDIAYEESTSKHLDCFKQIIENISECDEIIADVSYGNKPTPIAIQLALTFADLFGKNTVVKALIYGEIDFSVTPRPACIYDVSALFYMNQIMAQMTATKPREPLKFIEMILGNGGGDDGET